MAVLVISGPTSVGKSGLALQYAQQYGIPIISADAMTVYRELDIGTAKPSPAELETVQHYCVNIRDYDEVYTVGDFVEDVDRVLAQHPHVIIAGGTPYYLNALFRPMAPLPESVPEIRQRLEQLSNPHAILLEQDPVLAAKLHPNDLVRIVRALEVQEITGKPMSVVQRETPVRPPLDATIIWMDREDIRQRIQRRLSQMFAAGYLEECQTILEKGWDTQAKPLQSFSYVYLLEYLQGRLSKEEAIERTEIGTWHLARKQRTWARNIGWEFSDEQQARGIAERFFAGV